ncbi:glutathione S-transferase U17-like [Nymphaea colorata]|nr:glutathione S-transferase U17-like [Nymphaea colorata]
MEKQGEVKLIGLWASPFVLRVKVALNIKGVPYEYLEEQLPFSKSQLLLDSNPVHKKVPVLLHDGKPVCESLIIVEYIDEVWASAGLPAILPLDPYDRATARFWAAYIDEKFFGPMRGLILTEGEDGKDLLEQLMAALEQLEDAFRKCCKGGAFFGGETIGFLDLALGSFLGWLRVLEGDTGTKLLEKSKFPKLEAWSAAFCEAEPVKEVIPEAEKLAEFAKVLRQVGKSVTAVAVAAPPAS